MSDNPEAGLKADIARLRKESMPKRSSLRRRWRNYRDRIASCRAANPSLVVT